jgi:hypothetical protein
MVMDIEYDTGSIWRTCLAWIAWIALYESSMHLLRAFLYQRLIDPVVLYR